MFKYIYIWKLLETGIVKAWSDRKKFRSAGLSISFGFSKKFHKNNLPIFPNQLLHWYDLFTKSHSHFLPLKTKVNHRYILQRLSYYLILKEKWSCRVKKDIEYLWQGLFKFPQASIFFLIPRFSKCETVIPAAETVGTLILWNPVSL